MSIITDDNVSQYLLFAYEENVGVMYKLAKYYREKGDYNNMCKYYLMAIKKGEITAIHHLANYYQSIKAYNKMVKCYLLGVKSNDWFSRKKLIDFLKQTDDKIKYFNLLIKYEIIFNEQIQEDLCRDEVLKKLVEEFLLKEQYALI